MTAKEIVGLAGSALLAPYLFFLLWRMTTHKKSGISAMELILAGPLLFIRPERYFPEGKLATPWRYFMWWVVGAILIFFLTDSVARWVESRVTA